MVQTRLRKQEFPDTPIFNVMWAIDAPWAHPFWSQYMVMLYDLTTDNMKGVQKQNPVIHMVGATHEFLLYALDPALPIDMSKPIIGQKWGLLEPANLGYQFRAPSNEKAQERIQSALDRITRGELSPDTDFRYMWNDLFKDGHKLVRNRFTGN